MSDTGLMDRVRGFACDLIESSGGIVEWEPDADAGQGIVPQQVAGCFDQPDETIELSMRADGPGLSLNIAGSFLENAGKALQQFVPGCGSFAMTDLSVRKSDFQPLIDSTFGFQNARARIVSVGMVPVAYHAWWFHATLRSEDAWESVIQTTVNCESCLEIAMGDVLESIRFATTRNGGVDVTRSMLSATHLAEVATMKQAEGFFARIDQRLQADRKRLREYYGAMLKESAKPNRRTKHVPTESELADRERAVKLELQRKLGELDERFAICGYLRPVAVAECQIPSSVIELEVQRKAAKRMFRVYWNGMLKKLEPLACSKCGLGSFNLWFANETVDPVCNKCNNVG